MSEHGSGIKWKRYVVEIFKLDSSPAPSSFSLSFLLPLTVNPNIFYPWSDKSVETKSCAAADAAICSTDPISPLNETDSYILLFAPPRVLFLFKLLLWISAYLAMLSGRSIETDDIPLEYHLLFFTHWSALWLWRRIIKCSLSPSMHCFSSFVTYMLTDFTRVHSIIIKPSCIIIVRT